MRSNGLTAASYSPVADLDPRVADAFLLELKEQGIAAYTRPVESSSMSGFDRPEFREGALDRLYVDAAASQQVRAQLDDKQPGLASANDDLTWAQIVAGFDQPMTTPVAPWPANEDIDDEAEKPEPDPVAEREAWLRSTRVRADSLNALPGDDDQSDDDAWAAPVRAADDEEDRFVPPTPPPLPRLEPYKQLAWVGVLGGPLLLLLAVLFGIGLPTYVAVLAVGGFVGGFVTLVATMDDRDDVDPGNGAVV